MMDLVVGSFLVTIAAVVLNVCLRILSAAAAALVWRADRPVSLNPQLNQMPCQTKSAKTFSVTLNGFDVPAPDD